MQYKIIDESPWQILSNAMTIGPSSTGYQLQVAADGRNYTTLFTVGAGITRQITNLSSGSYFRMKGNVGEVTVNWVRDCSGGGGGTTYTAGEYISIAEDVISVTGITPDLYLTSADTQDLATESYVDAAITSATQDFATEAYVDAAITAGTQDFATQADITAATSPIEEHLNDVEYVTATALTELHNQVLEISGSTPDLSNYYTKAEVDAEITGATQGFASEAYVTAATANLMTSAATQGMIDEATSGITEDLADLADAMEVKEEVVATALVDLDERKVESEDVHTIVKLSQAEYDLIASPDPDTLYIIINNQ